MMRTTSPMSRARKSNRPPTKLTNPWMNDADALNAGSRYCRPLTTRTRNWPTERPSWPANGANAFTNWVRYGSTCLMEGSSALRNDIKPGSAALNNCLINGAICWKNPASWLRTGANVCPTDLPMSSNVSLNCLTNGAFLSKWNAANIPAAPRPRVARPPSSAGTIAAAIATPMAIPHGPAAASNPENMPPPPAPPPAASAVRFWPNRLLNEFAASSPASSASRFAESNPAFVSLRDLTTISTLFSATGHHLLRDRQHIEQPHEPHVRVGGRRDPEPLPQTCVHFGLPQLERLGYKVSIGSDATRSAPLLDGVEDAFGTCVIPENQPSNIAMNRSVSSDRT